MGVDGQPVRAASRTAIDAAIIRAAHFRYGGEPRILEDPIAERLLGPDMPEAIPPGDLNSRAGVLLRSRFAEDRVARAVERGVCQLVVLGAGLDSFAYRQPSWAESLSIFEIDQPSSLSDKRRRLAEGAIDRPSMKFSDSFPSFRPAARLPSPILASRSRPPSSSSSARRTSRC
jgi:methyltransferase (TIGR00027 family)